MRIHNHHIWPERESEEFVVAKKRGNSLGAKGLYYNYVSTVKQGGPIEYH